jgi:catechol 2,3-dioxygenase-like lactoylglutathione lyase family enzyme
MNKISHLSLLVHNQDDALAFYTEKLGFVITEAHKAEDGTWYWLTVAPTKDSSISLTLMLPQVEEDKALIGKQAGSIPFFCIMTDDCHATAAEFNKNGVEFVQEPQTEFWGINAILKDLYGNLVLLCQTPEEEQ